MADSILRLKVESQEYDNKLKQATNGLTRYVDECRKVGGTLEVVEKETLDYVRALGQMDTTSRTATGKLAEMKKTFVELSAQYKQMSDAEKNAPFGKALAASLDELKPRIIDTKNQLDEINKSIIGASSGGGGLFGGGKLDGMLQVFGGNLMTKGAAMVANFANEMGDAVKQGIELARQGEGIRIAFERLGRGDILQGLREATHGTVTDIELMKAAVKFNDFKLPLDEMGTMLAFAQQKAKDTGQSVDYMVDSIVTGLGRKSLMILDNLGLSASEVKERMAETGDMTKAVGDIIREQMSKAGDYVETAADRATQATVSLQNKMEELGQKFLPVQEASDQLWTSIKIGILDIVGGPLARLLNGLTQAGQIRNAINDIGGSDRVTGDINKLKGSNYKNAAYRSILESYSRAEQEARNNWLKSQKGGMGSIAVWENRYNAAKALREEFQSRGREVLNPAKVIQQTLPSITGGGGKSSKGFDISSIAFNAAQVSPEEMIAPPSVWKEYADGIRGTFDTIGDSMNNLTEWTKNFDPYRENMEKMTKAARQQQMAFSMAGEAANNFGAALAGIDDPAAKAAGNVIQAISSIALGFAMASSNANTAGTGWGWLAWLAAGTAAMATTISTIHSLTGFQNGGMIEGNTYSGDQIPIMANAGEVVLNKAQQATLAQNLQNNGGGMRVVGEIRGESIVLVANRYFKRTGQGEIVTW